MGPLVMVVLHELDDRATDQPGSAQIAWMSMITRALSSSTTLRVSRDLAIGTQGRDDSECRSR
jgi:hypothetical protein